MVRCVMSSIIESLLPLVYRIIAAAIVIIVVWAITRLLTKILQLFLKTVEAEYIVRISELFKLLLYFVAAIIAANIIAPEIQVFSVLLLVIGLAVVFMFYDVLRNIGAELYVRYRNIVRRGDWIEIEGLNIHVLDFDSLGLWGETPRSEKVFVPYVKVLNSIITNRLTLLGLVTRVQVLVPTTYNVDNAKNAIAQAVKSIEEELATEPEIMYSGSSGDASTFIVELRVVNYRKLGKIIETLEKEIRNLIPEAKIKT